MPYNSGITGSIIARLRRERKMSQEDLSAFAGIARSHLAMIETGKTKANVDTLWRISEALEIKLSELIRMVEKEHERLNRGLYIHQ